MTRVQMVNPACAIARAMSAAGSRTSTQCTATKPFDWLRVIGLSRNQTVIIFTRLNQTCSRQPTSRLG